QSGLHHGVEDGEGGEDRAAAEEGDEQGDGAQGAVVPAVVARDEEAQGGGGGGFLPFFVFVDRGDEGLPIGPPRGASGQDEVGEALVGDGEALWPGQAFRAEGGGTTQGRAVLAEDFEVVARGAGAESGESLHVEVDLEFAPVDLGGGDEGLGLGREGTVELVGESLPQGEIEAEAPGEQEQQGGPADAEGQ